MSVQTAVPNDLWSAYVDRFDYFTLDGIRPGCHPRILEHDTSPDKAVVLIHGLSDSPYFMSAIGEYFHNELGYNVYMPLLHFHGLKTPNNMEGVELEEWEENADFAIKHAADKVASVSIGGLSTGGALSFYKACNHPSVNGELYLFSAALDLAVGGGLIGELAERILRSFLVDVLDKNKPLIDENPYRYSHVDIDGARELARLIKRTDKLIKVYQKIPFTKRVFAAHSEADTTADIKGIETLSEICETGNFTIFRFKKENAIAHASLVLKDGIENISKPEPENPNFGEMMEAVRNFAL